MMLKGQNTRSMARATAWGSRAFFGLACPSAPSLGVNMLSYVNKVGTTISIEQRFTDCSRHQR